MRPVYITSTGSFLPNAPVDNDRMEQVLGLVGGKLECFYWMSGAFDGLAIIELPDGQSAGAFAAIVKGAGALKHFETHMVTSMNEAVAMLKKAQSATKSYRPPGR